MPSSSPFRNSFPHTTPYCLQVLWVTEHKSDVWSHTNTAKTIGLIHGILTWGLLWVALADTDCAFHWRQSLSSCSTTTQTSVRWVKKNQFLEWRVKSATLLSSQLLLRHKQYPELWGNEIASSQIFCEEKACLYAEQVWNKRRGSAHLLAPSPRFSTSSLAHTAHEIQFSNQCGASVWFKRNNSTTTLTATLEP